MLDRVGCLGGVCHHPDRKRALDEGREEDQIRLGEVPPGEGVPLLGADLSEERDRLLHLDHPLGVGDLEGGELASAQGARGLAGAATMVMGPSEGASGLAHCWATTTGRRRPRPAKQVTPRRTRLVTVAHDAGKTTDS